MVVVGGVVRSDPSASVLGRDTLLDVELAAFERLMGKSDDLAINSNVIGGAPLWGPAELVRVYFDDLVEVCVPNAELDTWVSAPEQEEFGPQAMFDCVDGSRRIEFLSWSRRDEHGWGGRLWGQEVFVLVVFAQPASGSAWGCLRARIRAG